MSNSFELCPTHFSRGCENNFRGIFPPGYGPACDGSIAIIWSLEGFIPLPCWRVKNLFCQVIRILPVHSLKVFQLSSDVNCNPPWLVVTGSGGSRPGVWGGQSNWGAPKCLHLLNTKGCLRQSLCVTHKRLSFVGQKVAIFVGRTMLFFRE